MRRVSVGIVVLSVALLAAGCSASQPIQAGASATVTPTVAPPTIPPASPSPASPTTSPSPSAAAGWAFVRTSCPGVSGEPLLLVALGTSETAGAGIGPDQAYPAQYADILCKELAKTVELHSYFPSQSSNEWATLAWWKEKLEGDAALRADLAAADVTVIWPLSIHEVVRPLLFGGCAGDWPDPLKACFEGITATIPEKMDALFGTIATLVPDGAKVLAASSYAPPALLNAWAERPYWPDVWAMTYPGPTVMALAPKHGFTFVDAALAFNGPTLDAMPAAGLFQADGLHPTAAGSLAIAKAFAAADSLGD